MGHKRLGLVFRGRHSDLHDLAWSEPLASKRQEMDPAVRAWVADRLSAEAVAFPGLTVVLFELGGDR